MLTLLKEIGDNIKLYRKAKGYTLDELAKIINKSKSTLSKYENGQISIDIATLVTICSTLELPLSRLMQQKIAPSVFSNKAKFINSFFDTPQLYMYHLDARASRIIYGMICFYYNLENKSIETTLYSDILPGQDHTKCVYLYYGRFNEYDSFSTFIFANKNTSVEQLTLTVINPICNSTVAGGLASGISSYPMVPFTTKCMLSKSPLTESGVTMEMLKLSKTELQNIKKNHRFIVESLPA